ncbi:MAG TPA: hypothetical protein VKE96_04010 [Vicinamibacterales bacterium]|nr:hypothetical protein [Vicinamibacterales bacterium]
MDVHRLAVFFHVAAVIAAFAALSIEWLGLRSLRRATSYEQAREWMNVWKALPAIGAPSLLAVLLSGIYLASSLGVWTAPWVAAAIPTLVIVAIAGGSTAPSRSRARAAIGQHTGTLPVSLQMQLKAGLWRASLRVRTVLLFGLVFQMTMKPEANLVVLAAVGLIAGVWGFAASRGVRA